MAQRSAEMRRPSADKGFTLLELLVALLIASLAITVVAPRFSALIPAVEIRSEAQKVAALLRLARSRAIAQGEVITLTQLDEPVALQLSGSEQPYTWPQTIQIELSSKKDQGDNPDVPADIAFFPDGSSSGGSITLESGAHRYEIAVNWLSGRVVIHD